MVQLDLDRWNRLTDAYCEKLLDLLQGRGAEMERIAGRTRGRLTELRDRTAISLAFIGQYNAGKSTIISALTGRDDIAISADIATDRCTPYEWPEAGLRLVDTPGLYTERPDHDELTRREIESSDLLAFCLTVSLFDPFTLQDFRQVASRDGYWTKMVLIVNKLLTEAGNTEERIAIYRQDLERMLGSVLLRQVPVVFVDARIYLDGIRGGNTALIAKSRFSAVVDALNRLSRERDLLGRADSGLRIVLGGTNAAIVGLVEGGPADKAYLHLLNRYLDAAATARRTLRRRYKDAAVAAARAILEQTEAVLASLDGTDPAQVAAAERQCQQSIGRRLAEIDSSLAASILEVGSALQREAEEIQSLPLFEQFIRRMDRGPAESGENGEAAASSSPAARWERHTATLQKIAVGFSGLFTMPLIGSAQQVPPSVAGTGAGFSAGSAAASGATTAGAGPPVAGGHVDTAGAAQPAAGGHAQVAVSQLDQVITGTIDHLNSTFHLHLSSAPILDSVHATSDFLQTFAPFLALGSAVFGIWEMFEEEKRTEQLGQLRLKLRKELVAESNEAGLRIRHQGEALDSSVLMRLEAEVRARRQAAEGEIAAESDLVARLRGLRGDLENSLRELAATVS